MRNRIARVFGVLVGMTLALGLGQLHGQIQGRGQCYWVVMADSARVSQHQLERTALNSLLAAHRAYPITVALWVWHDCAADLDRRHPSLLPVPTAMDTVVFEPPVEPIDTVVPDTLPDVVPDPEPPDVPVFYVPPPDTIGSAVDVQVNDDGSWRVIMGPGGQTFIRWYRAVTAGIWKVIVNHDGTGGGILFGEETFPLTEGEVVDVFYRSFAEPTGFILELDNLNAPMERTVRGLQLVPADLEEAIDAVVVPAELELAEGDEAQLCALAIMPTGQAILDAVQVAIPECRAALVAYQEGQE